MIKSIESQKPTNIIIIKDGEIIASLYVSDVVGGRNVDKVNMYTMRSDKTKDIYSIVLEV